MDMAYLAVTVFGMCAAVQPCRSMPTAAEVVAGTVATVPSSSSSVTGGQAVNDNGGQAVNGGNDGDGKRSRSLQFPQLPYHYDDDDDDNVQYDDVTANDLAAYYAQQQQQRIDGDVDDDDDYAEQQVMDARLSSRARPGKPAADSPVYFIRLPPQPYVYVPGYGYVSQPTRLEPPPFTQRPHSPFMNLPLGYVSNGKPVGVYTLSQQPQHHHDVQYRPQQQYQYHNQQQQQQQRPQPAARPKPNRRPQVQPVQVVQQQPQMPPPQEVVGMPADSPVYDLDKGPYAFNGRPSDAYLLHSAYDNLYSEVLQNIYP